MSEGTTAYEKATALLDSGHPAGLDYIVVRHVSFISQFLHWSPCTLFETNKRRWSHMEDTCLLSNSLFSIIWKAASLTERMVESNMQVRHTSRMICMRDLHWQWCVASTHPWWQSLWNGVPCLPFVHISFLYLDAKYCKNLRWCSLEGCCIMFCIFLCSSIQLSLLLSLFKIGPGHNHIWVSLLSLMKECS